MEYSQTLKLDIRDNHTYEQIYTKQSDKGYPLVFEITKDGKPFDLTGINASFRMTKPDGNIVLEDCTISDNTVSVDLSEQMTAVSGKCPFEISLSDGSSRVTTITGLIKVDASAVQSSTVSESVINLIIKSVNEARQYAVDANQFKESAATSATNSANSATLSQSWAVGGTNTRSGENTNNSKYYSQQSSSSATNAATSEANALSYKNAAGTSASNAATSASNAATSEANALSYKNAANTSATNAASSASSASTSKTNAATSASNALTYSKASQSYAVGTGGYRQDEAIDNSKYYYEQAKAIAEGLVGALIPMGTITFSQLATVDKVSGYMYNISDQFTTTSDFKEGAGHVMPAGTNVYCTGDLYWDCLAGSPVTGIKGDNEFSYRKGNVNITKDNIGLGNVANKFSQAIIVSDTEPTTQEVGDFWLQPYN